MRLVERGGTTAVAAGEDVVPASRVRDIALSAESEGAELSEAEWDAAWADEAEQRLLEIEEGKVKEIPGEEVTARVRAILRS
jgi:hypothetical protein